MAIPSPKSEGASLIRCQTRTNLSQDEETITSKLLIGAVMAFTMYVWLRIESQRTRVSVCQNLKRKEGLGKRKARQMTRKRK
ncbi:hypothetical protein B296_00055954 [Ensete ventricosum]|uniref:Uncharacterized protein n=1 Tax=Ensete ventricosum TaxID=4639 RepID=A0A426XXL2_ENSVE|nr:hypothetical protein B296_00055954 [Ensete ventricosum]